MSKIIPDCSMVELAWLAGILEGEGSFMMSRNRVKNLANKIYRYPKITVNMTDHDIIDRAQAILGGYRIQVLEILGKKTAYRIQPTGYKAAEWMRRLRPFMGVRRGAKIDEILLEWDSRIMNSNELRRNAMLIYRQRIRDGLVKPHPVSAS